MSERPTSRSDWKKPYTQGLLKQGMYNMYSQSYPKHLIYYLIPKQPSLANIICRIFFFFCNITCHISKLPFLQSRDPVVSWQTQFYNYWRNFYSDGFTNVIIHKSEYESNFQSCFHKKENSKINELIWGYMISIVFIFK